MSYKIGPTGHLITGDVLDVNKKSLEAKLRDIDPCLYLHWEPTKLYGHGCWELRRRPETKSVKDVISYGGNTYIHCDYHETDMNHVKDYPYLNYGILDMLRRADLWGQMNFDPAHPERLANWTSNIEKAEKAYKEKSKADQRAELRYSMLQDRSVIRDLRHRIASGVNPNLLGHFWNKK